MIFLGSQGRRFWASLLSALCLLFALLPASAQQIELEAFPTTALSPEGNTTLLNVPVPPSPSLPAGGTDLHLLPNHAEPILDFPVKLDGMCLGILPSSGNALMLFKSGLFILDYETRLTRMLKKAPENFQFITVTSPANPHFLALKNNGSLYLIPPDDSPLNIAKPVLPDIRAFLCAGGENEMGVIVIGTDGRQEGYFIRVTGSGGEHILTRLEPRKSDSRDLCYFDGRLVALPMEGGNGYAYHKGDISDYALPDVPETGAVWASLSGDPSFFSGVYRLDRKYLVRLPEGQKKSIDLVREERQGLSQQIGVHLLNFFILLLILLFWTNGRRRVAEKAQKADKTTRKKERVQSAGYFPRFIAFLIDIFLLSPLVTVTRLLLFPAMNTHLPQNASPEYFMAFPEARDQILQLAGIELVIWFVFLCLYHAYCDFKMQGSLGKRFLQIKVVSLDGKPPAMRQILIRSLSRLPDYSFGFLLMFFSRERQSLGDLLAGTWIVKDRPSD